MTDDSYTFKHSGNYTNREFLNRFLQGNNDLSVEQRLCKQFNLTTDSEDFKKIAWLGLLEDSKVAINDVSPAQILQKILEEKWKLRAVDKDMIVMQHQFTYLKNGIIFIRNILSFTNLSDVRLHCFYVNPLKIKSLAS